jgi:hypothetical protein
MFGVKVSATHNLMNTIERLRTPKLQWPIIVLLTAAILLILPHWGARAMLVGSALSLVVYSVVFNCSAVVRTILACLALAACVVAAYFIVHQ